MATKQGDIALLNDPIAKELLQSTIPARLAYIGSDGGPRVVPIWFHWNGKQIVLGTPLTAPKVKALRKNPKVAVTIDTNDWPHKVLQIRSGSGLNVKGHGMNWQRVPLRVSSGPTSKMLPPSRC